MPLPRVIAIDGPVAAGKTAVGQGLSERLGYRFLDTGSLYRAVTRAALDRGVGLRDEGALATLAAGIRIQLCDTYGQQVLVDGRDVTARLRSPEVEQGVSLVARIPGVRAALLETQRTLARQGAIVMVGRDIGTQVVPRADLKVFLAAPVEERAARRHRELLEKGSDATLEQVRHDLERRDGIDSRRKVAPLRAAPDAVVVDTEGLGVEGVIDRIARMVDQHDP